MLPKYLQYLYGFLLMVFAASSYAQQHVEHPVLAITHVTVIPMTKENKVIEDATIVIADNRIASINGAIPASAVIIEGRGKWLIPGLIDMHVHGLADGDFSNRYPTKGATLLFNTQDLMTPYVANGVTAIFELSARAEHLAQRNEILRGSVIGPRMALAALIDGGTAAGRVANTPEDGRQTVRLAKNDGYDFIKVYSQLNVETFKAIVDEAAKQGMKVIGHIPNAFQGRLEEAFVPNYAMVAHAEEFAKNTKDFSEGDVARFAKLSKENGTWLTPTLTVIERTLDQARSLDSIRMLEGFPYVHPLIQDKWLTANVANQSSTSQSIHRLEKIADFNTRLVRAFKQAGVPMVAGTDAGSAGVVWGFSLHDELELLVQAGLTPEEALTSATRLPATWLGIDSMIGTVETGKRADLLLLEANPLQDIHNARKIAGVFFDGRWIPKETIQVMLADLAKRNTADRGNYLWKKRKEY